jgi:hypothetical protein
MKKYSLKYSLIMVLVIMSFVFANSQARANLVSTFNIDKEGWRVFNRAPGGGEGDPTEYVGSYQNLGGNPGGFFQGADSGIGNTGFFVSPIDWAGNWSQYIGGTLLFDIKLIQRNGDPYLFSIYDVLIYTDANRYAYSKFGVDPQEGVWTNYQLQLIDSKVY